MSQIINQITDFFWALDKKRFNQITIGVLVGTTLILGGTLYFQWRRIAASKKTMTDINKNRDEIRKILERNEVIKKHQEHAKEIIAQEPDFYLIRYFQELLDKMHLDKNLESKDLQVNRAPLATPDFVEESIEPRLVDLNMEKLVSLLDALEKKERIIIKRVVITKSKKPQAIDVGLSISTIKAAGTTGASEDLEMG